MCTVSIKVDEDLIREVLPELEDTVAIRIWAQMLIDRHIEALIKEYAQQQDIANGLEPDFIYADEADETIDLETMRENLHQMIREVYAQP